VVPELFLLATAARSGAQVPEFALDCKDAGCFSSHGRSSLSGMHNSPRGVRRDNTRRHGANLRCFPELPRVLHSLCSNGDCRICDIAIAFDVTNPSSLSNSLT
jgi:hypothetical protein